MGARLLISARWYDPGHRPNRPKAWPRTPTPVIAWIDLGPALSPNMHAEQGGHIMRTLFSDPPDELGAEPCCASMERCEVCGHPLRCTVHGWGLFGVRQRCGPCSSAKPSEEPKTCDRCLHAYTSSTHEPCRSCLKTSKVSRSWTRWEPRYFAKPSEAASLRAQVATLTRERLEALEKAAGRERQLSRAWENERAAESALTAARGALAEVKRRAALPIQTHVRGLATTEEQLSAAITSCVKQAVEHVSEPARAALAATAPAVAETTAGCATCGDQGTVEEMIGFGGENPELVMEPCPSCSPPPPAPGAPADAQRMILEGLLDHVSRALEIATTHGRAVVELGVVEACRLLSLAREAVADPRSRLHDDQKRPPAPSQEPESGSNPNRKDVTNG